MVQQNEVLNSIIELEKLLFDNEAYLNESEQSKIQTLYQLLGRTLTDNEKELVYQARLEFMEYCVGEQNKDYLNLAMYYEM